MYKLIIDGEEKSVEGDFQNEADALCWYNYARTNGANSAALWRDQELLQSFVKGE